ncbi:MAG: lytic murein transglycosylase B [Gammaproteobacteria bacterium]|jgi:membrane-bound lytic murein transglycosylase B
MRILFRCLPALLLGAACPAIAQETHDPAAVRRARTAFIERVVPAHQLERDRVESLLESAAINDSILAAISRPAERVVPWYDYRNIFLTDSRITDGAAFWRDNSTAVTAMARRFGVDAHIIVAIIGVETLYGKRMGTHRVVDALSTLAFAYPPRSEFFSGELEAFLLLDREEGYSLSDVTGSYAGAMGAGQFIPSSFRAYAVDGNDDGRRDLWGDWDDILASVANYLARHGWHGGGPVAVPVELPAGESEPDNRLSLNATVAELRARGYAIGAAGASDDSADVFSFERSDAENEYWVGFNNFYVITRYNRSTKYALAVLQLANAIRDAFREHDGGPA